MFDPPDDDKARDTHVVPQGEELSDAGSIPAASTFNNNFRMLLHGRPPKSQERPNGHVPVQASGPLQDLRVLLQVEEL